MKITIGSTLAAVMLIGLASCASPPRPAPPPPPPPAAADRRAHAAAAAAADGRARPVRARVVIAGRIGAFARHCPPGMHYSRRAHRCITNK